MKFDVMEFDLAEQRAGAREQLRIADLMSLAPAATACSRSGRGIAICPDA